MSDPVVKPDIEKKPAFSNEQIGALLDLANVQLHSAATDVTLARKGCDRAFETSLGKMAQTAAMATAAVRLLGLASSFEEPPGEISISSIKMPDLNLTHIFSGKKRAVEALRHIVEAEQGLADTQGLTRSALVDKMGYRRDASLRDPLHPLQFSGLIEDEGDTIKLSKTGRLLFLDGPLSEALASQGR